jgi:Tol biopolymer transport system component
MIRPTALVPLVLLVLAVQASGPATQAASADRIVFSRITGSNYGDIYALDPVTLVETQITSGPAGDVGPSISPDGNRIAFSRDGVIYTADSAGGNLVPLTSGSGSNWSPDWSPDASRIVFVADSGGTNEIFVMNADGSNVTRLTNNGVSEREPSWSPDGSRIAFERDVPPTRAIFLMNADGSDDTRLTTIPSFDPAWSPDGARIAFTSDELVIQIYSIGVDGSGATNLTNTAFPIVNSQPVWSPDGARIAFVREPGDGITDLWTMSSNGGNQTQITFTSGGLNNGPHEISPDWGIAPAASPTPAPTPSGPVGGSVDLAIRGDGGFGWPSSPGVIAAVAGIAAGAIGLTWRRRRRTPTST